jgi:hypothetical protein
MPRSSPQFAELPNTGWWDNDTDRARITQQMEQA